MAVATSPRATSREAGSVQRDGRPDGRPTPTASPRLPGADVLRAAAAVAVIVIHASYWPLQDRGADDAVWGSITLLARFAVPAFVILTGLVLGFRYGDEKLGRAFLLRRARRSVVPWLIWAPVFCIADITWIGGVRPSWSSVAAFFSGGAGHLYFLVLVPQLYVLLLAWPARRRPLAWVTGLAVALQLALTLVRLDAPMPGGLPRALMLDHGFELFPFWIGYFALGVLAGRRLRERRGRGFPAWPFALAVAPAAALLLWNDVGGAANAAYAQGTGAFLRPTLVPFALVLCAALLFARPRMSRPVGVLSRHSLGIYIVHPIFLAALGQALSGTLHHHLPWSILPFLAITIGCGMAALVTSMLLARTPLALAVGAERVRRRETERELVGRRQEVAAARR